MKRSIKTMVAIAVLSIILLTNTSTYAANDVVYRWHDGMVTSVSNSPVSASRYVCTAFVAVRPTGGISDVLNFDIKIPGTYSDLLHSYYFLIHSSQYESVDNGLGIRITATGTVMKCLDLIGSQELYPNVTIIAYVY